MIPHAIKQGVNTLASFYNDFSGYQPSASVNRIDYHQDRQVEDGDFPYHVSQFDPNVKSDNKMWAVTLIVDHTIFHAKIIVEGVEENFGPFFQIADLKRPSIDMARSFAAACCCCINVGSICLSNKKHPPLNLKDCKGKSDTWLRPKAKVELMIAKILEEKTKNVPAPFSIFGRRSMFSKEVEFFETENPELSKLLKDDPKKFSMLYNLREHYISYKKKESSDKAEEAPRNIITKNYHYTRLLISDFIEGLPKNDYFLFNPATILSMLFVGGPILLGSSLADSYVQETKINEIEDNRNILELMENSVKRITKFQDNCYTWGGENLKIVDIYIPEYPSDRWIAISTLFASKTVLL